MAAVKGVNNTIIATGGESQILQGQVDARLKCFTDSYVPLGTEAAGSTIAIGPTLPAGARIRDVKIINAAQDASVTLKVGDSNDDDRYVASYAATAILVSGAILAAGFDYVIGTNSGDTQVLITTGGATLGVGDTIKAIVVYSVD